MKQRITAEDLQQLTDAQKQKLREWWKPEMGDMCINGNIIILFKHGCSYFGVNIAWNNDYNYNYPSLEMVKKYCLPLLSIGQMIELLLERYGNSQCDICCQNTLSYVNNGNSLMHNRELCDALWEAVKQIL